ncbi:hypothetical protein vBAmePPT11V19_00041 [Alteromonas phage vB_AmeP_PT11-V19]|nr:hypothetical protein vBAmePPT11V19_00041 [Alteromonas phage vB_AmeP_PT11-V19]
MNGLTKTMLYREFNITPLYEKLPRHIDLRKERIKPKNKPKAKAYEVKHKDTGTLLGKFSTLADAKKDIDMFQDYYKSL